MCYVIQYNTLQHSKVQSKSWLTSRDIAQKDQNVVQYHTAAHNKQLHTTPQQTHAGEGRKAERGQGQQQGGAGQGVQRDADAGAL